uniref:Vacuolar protein sorting-associated protein 45 n=1 Tax=Chromera velia CCMP2878 TaxID=1169474 RepID=A0A0G4GLA5_9ALVE|eukprot:Cvel_677.t1-p1 / transcript=Cvel_677.t1 / gene=Cvel_677 / organism=Chromera_velia_CCMP2878 / gene_product=Vacuolar protein sorting-associated protein 45, putative / transcript_product=Vacuolar protein sorting-associated protein 45, putative / location=Cvel_scaffold21:16703-22768(-) / protein_length=628 / sequence_SO=supercontig / SO=protein_coding / is_pseudo=false
MANLQELSIVSCLQEYVRSMIDKVGGMKVLILDKDTTGIISLLYSQTQILEKEVFLVEKIDVEHKEKMKHVNAIVFVRPTTENFIRLVKELRKPCYGEYHLFFSNVVKHDQLEKLAKADECEVVKQVQEFYADVFAMNHNLFSLNIPSTSGLTQDPSGWSLYVKTSFSRVIEGLLSAVLALRRRPMIRFQRTSHICHEVAMELQRRMSTDSALFDSMGLSAQRAGGAGDLSGGPGGTVLLIFDRREDPVTPLLNQWTYQAMVHELLGIENNRVNMRKAPGISAELEEIVLNPAQDRFFEENLMANYGELGVAIRNYVDQYQERTKTTARIESIEDMQRFVDSYPEFRKMSGNVSKHVAVVHELHRLVQMHHLLEVSSLEQDIACSDKRSEHLRSVLDMIRSSECPSNMERLRLVMLFALRYESDHYVSQLKEELRSAGVDDTRIALIDQLLSFAGRHARQLDLFQSRSLFAATKKAIQRGFKGVPNVLTQHTSLLHSILESLLKGKLRENDFPYVQPGPGGPLGGQPSVRPPQDATGRPAERPSEVIVFIVGGCTCEEARDVTNLSKETGARIVLGGTSLVNSQAFLADVAQLAASRRSGVETSAVRAGGIGAASGLGFGSAGDHEKD